MALVFNPFTGTFDFTLKVTATAPLVLTGEVLSIPQASPVSDGYLSAVDYNAFALGGGLGFPLLAPPATVGAPSYTFFGNAITGIWQQATGHISFATQGATAGYVDNLQQWTLGGPSTGERTHRIVMDETAGSGQKLNFQIGNSGVDQGCMSFQWLNSMPNAHTYATWKFEPRLNDDSGSYLGGELKFHKIPGSNSTQLRLDLWENVEESYTFFETSHPGGRPTINFNPYSNFLDDFEISHGSVNNALIISGAPGQTGANIKIHGTGGGNANNIIFKQASVVAALKDQFNQWTFGSASANARTHGFYKDVNAGDSTTAINLELGNSGSSQGKAILTYNNAAPNDSPYLDLLFRPRDTTGATILTMGQMRMAKRTGNSGGDTYFSTSDTSGNLRLALTITAEQHTELAPFSELRFADAVGGQYVGFKSPATVTGTITYELPAEPPATTGYLYSDNAGILTWVTPSASGDVVGPAGATDTAIALYDGITGKLIKDSLVTINGSGNIVTPGTISASNFPPTGAANKFVRYDGTGNLDQISSWTINPTDQSVGILSTGSASSFTFLSMLNSGNVTGNLQAFNIALNGDCTDKIFLDLYSASGTVSNLNGIRFNPIGTATGNAVGLDINLSQVVSPNQKTGLSISDASLFVNNNYNTSVYPASPGFVQMNALGGTYTVASGSPVSNTIVLANNLGLSGIFLDDFGPDAFGGFIGFSQIAYASQLVAADTKTVDTVNLTLAGAQIPDVSGMGITDGGTITNLCLYRGLGLLPAGGNITITNMYGIRFDPLLSTFATTTWGISVEDTNANNYFAKNVVIGGMTKLPTGSAVLDVTGDAVLTGDVASATLTPANGATGTFTTVDLKTVTVVAGIIVSIV